ncbi:hypothetical protein LCGC14_1394560 [marine sediment metagenome]|uniref:Rhamnogalacturonase A/B/Epimerase-like pectate lyase domain-containing protein n=1 Tax=marine sediment metagenome TaxID=412755 RepID=A0A0F9JYZ2_9ZZZZ
MKRLFIILGIFVCFSLLGQDLITLAHNTYGIQVREAIDTNQVRLKAAIILNDAELAALITRVDTDSARTDINSTQLADSLKVFNVLSHGAIDDGTTDNTIAFQNASDAAGVAGGGIVFVPEGDFNIDGKVTIDNDFVEIRGVGQGSKITFTDTDRDIGFHFVKSGDQIYNCGVRGVYIWLEEDTISAIKFTRGLFNTVENVRIRNNSGAADMTTAVSILGTGDWAGGNNINRCLFHDIHTGVFTDSVSNHNIITDNWIWGNVAKHAGSRGCKFWTNDSPNSDTQYLSGNDFEGWAVAVENRAFLTRFIGNRFEACDTAIISDDTSIRAYMSGNTYANITTEIVSGASDYNYRNDVGRAMHLPPNISGNVGIELHEHWGVDGPWIDFTDGAVSSSLSLLELSTHGSSSHTNVFGETLTLTEGIVSSDYDLKIGATNSDSLNFYTNSILRMSITPTGIIVKSLISHSLTDGAPTDAEIDAATGTTPAGAGAGATYLILDSDGSALIYKIVSDGSSWQYEALAIAS